MMEVKYTQTGQRYLVVGHCVRSISLTSVWHTTLHDIELTCGLGTRLYFSFLLFIMATNVAFSIVSVILWSVATFFSIEFGWGTLHYGPIAAYVWKWACVAMCISWHCAGVVYFLWEQEESPDPLVNVAAADSGILETHVTAHHWRWRKYIGHMCIVPLLSIGTAILYGLVYAQATISTTPIAASAMSMVVSLGFVLLVQVWNILSYKITEWEHNKTWFAFRMSQSAKLILFKITLFTMLYLIISLVLTSW